MTSTTVANTVFTISLIPFLTAFFSFFFLFFHVGGSEAALAVVGGFVANEPGAQADVHILCTAVYPPRQQHTMAPA